MHRLVIHAVSGNLVTRPVNTVNQRGAPLGHPPEHKERGRDSVIREPPKHEIGISLDPGLAPAP